MLPPTRHGEASLVEVLAADAGLTPTSRVLVVSGSFGAGHDAAAREIARRLQAHGCRVRSHDIVESFPGRSGRVVRAAYPLLLRWWPAGWALVLHRLRPGRRAHTLVRRALGLLGERLLPLEQEADLVVSTHPFASQALGHQRSNGRLTAPVATYLTDAGVHALWVNAGVDVHLALHESAGRQAAALLGGASRVRRIRPLVPAAYRRGLDAAEVRRVAASVGAPVEAAMVLVVGGSLGVGQLCRTARDVRDAGCGTPVVLCGRNDRLRRRLARETGVIALGWRDDLPDLIRAADCVVQNAGGFTAWESLAAGTPVLTYRSITGHGAANAIALAQDGTVPWARSRDDLHALLSEVLLDARDPLAS